MSDDLLYLEEVVGALTLPLNGQYPRPWMTSLTDPTGAKVFTVGKNQRNGFDVGAVGSHASYLDALFNRGPETCRQLYDRLVPSPSPTRRNTDNLVAKLNRVGVSQILETNVICYSTPMSSNLRDAVHTGGTQRGSEIFSALLDIIQPKVLIVHGSDTASKLGRLLGSELPSPPREIRDPTVTKVDDLSVIVIPSLAPPQFNKWARWSDDHLNSVAAAVAALVVA